MLKKIVAAIVLVSAMAFAPVAALADHVVVVDHHHHHHHDMMMMSHHHHHHDHDAVVIHHRRHGVLEYRLSFRAGKVPGAFLFAPAK